MSRHPWTSALPSTLIAAALGLLAAASTAPAETPKIDTVLYGVAYYHEYMPYERLDKDVELMKRAGITRRARGRVDLDELGAARGRVPVRVDGPGRRQDARRGHRRS